MPTLTVLLALTGVAEATNVVVPTQQPTISAAVASLAGPGPHTIQITVDNTYVEADTIDTSGKDITIVGTGSDTTIVRVSNPLASTVFRTSSGRLVLDGITVTGDISGAGAGLNLVDNLCNFSDNRRGVESTSSTIEIYDAELRCFFSRGAGAAIHGINSDIVIDGSNFEQNISLGSGGHVFAGGNTISPPDVTISNTDFFYGFSISDGGAISVGNAKAEISRNRFFYNDAVVQGGAIALHNSVASASADVYENTFQQNHAITDLGFTVFDFADAFGTGTITATIDFNLLVGDGGAVYANTESIDLWANLFCGNFSDRGGAVYLEEPPASIVQNNVFNDNWSVHYGGGLYMNAVSGMAEPEVYNNTFYANSAGFTPPESTQLVVFGAGGAAFFDGTVVDFHNNIVANTQHGGGVGGVDGPNYIIGDPLKMKYNLWFDNREDFSGTDIDLTGDFAQHTLNQTNVLGQPPYPTFGNYIDLDCYPDAFYPVWGSPAINRGDDTNPSWADIDGSRNDIGFTGGPRAPVLDRDNDGYMNTVDCNDTDPAVNPTANEVCDLQDNDCDGEVDEGAPNTWYEDNDGDGYGTADPTVQVLVQCAPPAGYVSLPGDCNDGDANIHPGAAELCDEIDNDCNGTVDDDSVLDFRPYYVDNDGDGYGQSSSYVEDCVSPGPTYTDLPGDCNDADALVYPGATEICDDQDNDCNGLRDDGADGIKTWYLDGDGDGYGIGTGEERCSPPNSTATYAEQGGDCDDNNLAVNPGAPETCDDPPIDNNCDGLIDNDPTDGDEYYQDADNDGYYDGDVLRLCEDATAPEGYKPKSAYTDVDCDASDPTNSSPDCYKNCDGCQTGPVTGPTGMLSLLGGLLIGLRRRG